MKRNSSEAEKTKLILYFSIIASIGLITGFFMGRDSVKQDVSVRYIKGDTIEKRIEIPIPYAVEIPSEPVYIFNSDTAWVEIAQRVDTGAIINDWISKRSYREVLFDNQYGKLNIEMDVQYNKLTALGYNFIPIEKVTTIKERNRIRPFVGASYSSLNYVGLGGGLLFSEWGVGVMYVTDFEKNGAEVTIMRLF